MEIKLKMETLLSSETKTVTIYTDGPFTIIGVNINLGASNVSLGLPDRHTINQVFLSLAVAAGSTCAITDPMKLSMPSAQLTFCVVETIMRVVTSSTTGSWRRKTSHR